MFRFSRTGGLNNHTRNVDVFLLDHGLILKAIPVSETSVREFPDDSFKVEPSAVELILDGELMSMIRCSFENLSAEWIAVNGK